MHGNEQRTGRAYLGSFTSRGGRGITTAAVDPGTGALRVLHHTDALPDPTFLGMDTGGAVLHAVSETADGRAAAFSLAGPDGPVLLRPAVPVEGAGPTHLAVTGHRLYTAQYTSGSISALALGPDRAPVGSPVVHAHRGSGPVAGRQDGPHAHAVVPSPDGAWLLATDLGTDSVRVYALDAADGTPRPHAEVRLRPGSGPRHLAFHPGGRAVHVLNELEPTLTRCRWEPADGTLTPLEDTPVLPPDTSGDHYPSGLVVTANGRRAYAAIRGHDSIAVLSLDPADGRAGLRTHVPCGGVWPRALALGAAERHLYVANERSGDVTWFDLSAPGGVPRPAGTLRAPAVSCVVLR
ncbi:lactonase family protein [Streptomyces sp. ACA25]|uniref:lactonase family protein n=1 Tax=Streptomyces sp. ACA25 TaxID=3022596 RepID=UPI0023082976|nr:lactonase family protein [Streptomyces sp. ACA25]MDB1089297.1 lactonase family protein [Streptomyces sp. ACA25]